MDRHKVVNTQPTQRQRAILALALRGYGIRKRRPDVAHVYFSEILHHEFALAVNPRCFIGNVVPLDTGWMLAGRSKSRQYAVARATVSRSVSQLEARGLARRWPEGRRAKGIRLTRKGLRAARNLGRH